MEENTYNSSEYNEFSKINPQYLAEDARPLKPSRQENNFDEIMPIDDGNKFSGDINAEHDEKPVGVGTAAGNNNQFLSEYPEGIFFINLSQLTS